jgi:hypothetical protein
MYITYCIIKPYKISFNDISFKNYTDLGESLTGDETVKDIGHAITCWQIILNTIDVKNIKKNSFFDRTALVNNRLTVYRH